MLNEEYSIYGKYIPANRQSQIMPLRFWREPPASAPPAASQERLTMLYLETVCLRYPSFTLPFTLPSPSGHICSKRSYDQWMCEGEHQIRRLCEPYDHLTWIRPDKHFIRPYIVIFFRNGSIVFLNLYKGKRFFQDALKRILCQGYHLAVTAVVIYAPFFQPNRACPCNTRSTWPDKQRM